MSRLGGRGGSRRSIHGDFLADARDYDACDRERPADVNRTPEPLLCAPRMGLRQAFLTATGPSFISTVAVETVMDLVDVALTEVPQ